MKSVATFNILITFSEHLIYASSSILTSRNDNFSDYIKFSRALENGSMHSFIAQISSLYRILRLGGGSRELGGVLFFIGEIKNFAFFQTRKFSKNAKNQ